MFEHFITTVDSEGRYQPSPPVPDWPHISELQADGWELIGLFDTEREEATAVFKRQMPFSKGLLDNVEFPFRDVSGTQRCCFMNANSGRCTKNAEWVQSIHQSKEWYPGGELWCIVYLCDEHMPLVGAGRP